MASRLQELVQLVRAYTRDYPELNRLIRGPESSSRSIAIAIASTVEDFNLTSPLPAYTVDSFPSTQLLLLGSVKKLLESVSLLQARNHISYSDGQGVQVNESDKAPLYLNIIRNYASEYEQKKRELIIRLNISQAMGGCGIRSDFSQAGTWPTLEIDLMSRSDYIPTEEP